MADGDPSARFVKSPWEITRKMRHRRRGFGTRFQRESNEIRLEPQYGTGFADSEGGCAGTDSEIYQGVDILQRAIKQVSAVVSY